MSAHALLTREEHGALRVRPGADPAADAVMQCLVVPNEFRRVAAAFPILFQRDATRDRFHALALLGFEPGENLFLVDGARWDARYRPLALAIQPFLIGGPARREDGGAGGDGQAAPKQVHVDLASPRIAGAGEGVALFDEFGRPTPYLEQVAGQLGELDAGWQALDPFVAALERHRLLEPLTLEITLDSGAVNRLVGYHSIDEEQLAALDAAALGELHRDGWLLPVFMALASLGQLPELIARKNAKVQAGG